MIPIILMYSYCIWIFHCANLYMNLGDIGFVYLRMSLFGLSSSFTHLIHLYCMIVLHMCICAHKYMYSCVSIHIEVRGHPQELFFEWCLHHYPRDKQLGLADWVASSNYLSVFSCSWVLALQIPVSMPSISYGSCVSSSGPPTCTLPTKSRSQTLNYFWNLCDQKCKWIQTRKTNGFMQMDRSSKSFPNVLTGIAGENSFIWELSSKSMLI